MTFRPALVVGDRWWGGTRQAPPDIPLNMLVLRFSTETTTVELWHCENHRVQEEYLLCFIKKAPPSPTVKHPKFFLNDVTNDMGKG